MAKAAKSSVIDIQPGKPATSYLAAAYHSFQQGDAVRTRQHARRVLQGKGTPHEGKAARVLAPIFGMLMTSPEQVAAQLIQRTQVPLKSFGFAALSAVIFIVLLTLAVTRYGA